MTNDVVICEKPSQRRNILEAVGERFGQVVAAQGHLLELVEPHEMRPEWKSWSTELLHPGEPYPTKPARGRTQVLARIRAALKDAGRVIVATDMGREGHLIGMELIEHLRFRGEVLRANFRAEDAESIREAFGKLEDASEHAGLLAAAKARQQADQICNLTLTRAATVTLLRSGSGALGLGRVRTPTLAIICMREKEIVDFVPETRWAVEAVVEVEGGSFTAVCRWMPGTKELILERDVAVAISRGVQGWQGAIGAQVKAGRRGPPAPHDLAALQSEAGRKLKWTARRTLEVAQALYSDLKLITYPRVDARVWPEGMAGDAAVMRPAVCRVLGRGDGGEPVIRAGKTRACQFSDARMQGHEHHAIAPNIRMVGEFGPLWAKCSDDQRKLAEIIFRRYAAITSAEWQFDTLTLSFTAPTGAGGALFQAAGKSTTVEGWTAWEGPPKPVVKDGEEAETALPAVADGAAGRCTSSREARRETKPPARYGEGNVITAMKEAWRYLPEGEVRERLKEAGGIGTSATRDQVIETLVKQGQIAREKGRFRPTEAGMKLWELLRERAPGCVDPGTTAAWESEFDRLVQNGGAGWMRLVDRLAAEARKAVEGICGAGEGILDGLDRGSGGKPAKRRTGGGKMASEKQLNFIRKLAGERGEEVDEKALGEMDVGAASAEIDRLMALKRTDGGGGGNGGGRDMKPTAGRLSYARDLARKAGIELPKACESDWRECKRFIDEHAGGGGE